MDNLEAARQILEVFKQGRKFLNLHDLANQSGFKKVSNRDFKDGFNYLVDMGVIKLQQSGWPSEKRGGKSHPKTVILTADLYEVTDSDFQIDYECVNTLGLGDVLGSNPVQTQFETENKDKGHRPRAYCIDCPQFIQGELSGSCKRYPWEISMKLASIDKVCSYDSFKDTFFGDDKPRKPEKLEAWKKDW